MNAMLFAAGFGTRMRPLTDTRPKPLIDVAGRPMIDHARALLRHVAPQRVVANAHYKAEMILAHLAGTEVTCIVETPDILETGGGLRNALPHLGPDPVFTLNTDAIWPGPNPLPLLAAAWDPERMDALLVCVPVRNAVGYAGSGDFQIDADGRLSRGADYAFGGIQIIRTGGLHQFDAAAFSLNLLWDRMATSGRLFGLPYSGPWCDVGTPEGIPRAERMIADAAV